MQEGLTYEGLREVAKALAVIDHELLGELKLGLRKVGEVVEHEARRRFVAYKPDDPWAAQSAESFETRVRAGSASSALAVVGQRRRRSGQQQLRRSNWGGLQVKHALLPALGAMLGEASEVLEREVHQLLKRHGF